MGRSISIFSWPYLARRAPAGVDADLHQSIKQRDQFSVQTHAATIPAV